MQQNCSDVNAKELHLWKVYTGSGNGLVPLDSKLRQCWSRSIFSCGVTKPQWIKRRPRPLECTTCSQLGRCLTINQAVNTLRISDAYIDGLVRDWSNSSALAIELLQSCSKPSMCIGELNHHWFTKLATHLFSTKPSPEQLYWVIVNCTVKKFNWK